MVDGLSLHAYYGNTQPLTGDNVGRYLAMNLDMEQQIREIAAVCDYVQALRKSSKRLWLSFDEWNVWYRARSGTATNGAAAVRAAAARGSLQPRRRAAGRRVRQHAAAEFGSGARGVPGAAGERDRAARHQRHRRAAPEHLLSLLVGARSTRRAGCWICASSRRCIPFVPPACRRISPGTTRCRSSTSSRRSTPRMARPRC